MQLAQYSASDAALWDALVAQASMGTFLHTRRYLAYHHSRFRDVSALIKDEQGRLLGVFPAAVDLTNERRVVSHPGITYGGVLHDGALRGERMVAALQTLCRFYAELGFETLRYKAVPYIYQRMPAADDLYALFRLAARRYRCDLSSTIDLTDEPALSTRRRRGLKKALKADVQFAEGAEFIVPLWRVLTDNLERKHGVSPVHTAIEIGHLYDLFPANIEFVVAQFAGVVEAGVVLFLSAQVVHAQYIAASLAGYELCALDALFAHCIERARVRGARYFDFGNSNEREGQYLNAGLHQFKSEFGAGGVVHDFYELDLRSLAESHELGRL